MFADDFKTGVCQKILMNNRILNLGVTGFEPATPSPPEKCATTALHPDSFYNSKNFPKASSVNLKKNRFLWNRFL